MKSARVLVVVVVVQFYHMKSACVLVVVVVVQFFKCGFGSG